MCWAGAALSVPRSELGLRALLEWSGNASTASPGDLYGQCGRAKRRDSVIKALDELCASLRNACVTASLLRAYISE